MWRRILILSIATLGLESASMAQEVVLQVINGKTNKPVTKAKLYVSFPPESNRQPIQLSTNDSGQAMFDTGGATHFQVHPIALVTCGEQPPGAQPKNYAVDEITRSGLITTNDCGHSGREPLKGQLAFFVRPAGWWELFKN